MAAADACSASAVAPPALAVGAAPAPAFAGGSVPTIGADPARDLWPTAHGAPGLRLQTSAVDQSVIGPAVPVRPVAEPEGITQRAARQARAFLWMELAGALVIIFVAYQLWGTGFEQRRAQAHLRHAYFASASGSGGSGDAATVGGASSPSKRPSLPRLPGGALARIEIPAIHLDQFVVEGTSESDLKRGPGHYPGSPVPGQPGNSAIAGHRTTYGAPFSRLDELKAGDTIITTTATGRYLYVVARQLVVSPGETSVVDDYGDNRLTLTTCTPKFLATQRLVVVASLSGLAPAIEAARTAAPPLPATRPVAPAGPAAARLRETNRGFSLGALPLSLVVIALMVGLGLLYRPVRRHLPPVAAAAVLMPFWVAVVLVLFEQLTKLLPPNV
ncbi:MAG TPA: sortase [Gemmatimonadales bacterium]|nr:sortase [Gemmatimonadales bacterium]